MKINTVKDALDELKNIDIENDYAYEKVIWKYLTCVNLPIFACKIPKNTIIFRTRTHEDNKLYTKISDIGLVPKQIVANFGRCNKPFQSVFYSSDNRPTSYSELVEDWARSKNNGDRVYVTIGAWKLKEDADFIIVTSPNKEDRISDFDKEHGPSLEKFISGYNPEDQEILKEIYQFLFEIFRKPSNGNKLTYLLTTAYSNLSLMHDEAKAHGIYYPSVASGDQGVNFAINESFSRENLELIYAMCNEFEVSFDENKKFHCKEIGKMESKNVDLTNNRIEW